MIQVHYGGRMTNTRFPPYLNEGEDTARAGARCLSRSGPGGAERPPWPGDPDPLSTGAAWDQIWRELPTDSPACALAERAILSPPQVFTVNPAVVAAATPRQRRLIGAHPDQGRTPYG